MNLCSNHHTQICFEVSTCPLCAALREIEFMDEECKKMRKRIAKNLEAELKEKLAITEA